MLRIWLLITLILTIPILFTGNFPSSEDIQQNISNKVLGTDVRSEEEIKAFNEKMIANADKQLTAKPNPIVRIALEGKLPSNPDTKRTHESMRDLPKIYDLSYAYAVTRDTKYSDKAIEFFIEWSKVNKSYGNPIDDTHLETIFESYKWIKDALTPEQDQIIQTWFASIAEAQINGPLYGAQNYNNWLSHRIKIVGLIGFATKNQDYIDYAVQTYKTHLDSNLNPDGTSYDYIERNALFYHAYDLEPLLVFAKEASLNGIDVYTYTTPEGANLKKSVEFLIPYINSQLTHQEFIDSKADFDRVRAQTGQADYQSGRLFRPAEGLKVLEYYYFFEPSVLPIIQEIKESKNLYPTFNVYLNTIQRNTTLTELP